MRDHAIISPRFWIGETGKKFRGDRDAQLVCLYLMTCPASNMIGLFNIAIPTLCHETGLSEKGALKGLQRGEGEHFLYYDRTSETIFIPQMAKYQLGDTITPKDNRHKAIIKILQQYHKSPFVKDFLDIYAGCYCIDKEALLQAPSKPLQRGVGKILAEKVEQEQEQEQDKVSSEPLRADSEPPVLQFPVVGKGGNIWTLTADKVRELSAAFPSVDVLAESRKALAWCNANPSKQKTVRGMPAFLFRWMEKTQNSGRVGTTTQPQPRPEYTPIP